MANEAVGYVGPTSFGINGSMPGHPRVQPRLTSERTSVGKTFAPSNIVGVMPGHARGYSNLWTVKAALNTTPQGSAGRPGSGQVWPRGTG